MLTLECKNGIFSLRQLLCTWFYVSEISHILLAADHSYFGGLILSDQFKEIQKYVPIFLKASKVTGP